jgi:predicted TIM-barrel fold metal-dependent hydrolase
MRIVALEEHCVTSALREVLGEQIHPYYPVHRWPAALEARLADIGEGRIAEMDAAGVSVQVLSTAQPGLEHVEAARAIPVAREFNDTVAAAVAAHPDRFAGFAALPSAAPDAAAAELERAVTALGMVGAMVNGRTLERFLDEPFFWPIFEAAEALRVPLYLHPMPPPKAVYDAYYAGFGDDVGFMLGAGAWGWHIEIGLHCLRLILAGVLDRFPALQLIIGHMGEALPFMIHRASDVLGGGSALGAVGTRMEHPIATYFRRNFHLTTSGFFTDPTLRCALDVIGEDRVMFSVDHPFADSRAGTAWLERTPIAEGLRAKVAHANADRLLGLTTM